MAALTRGVAGIAARFLEHKVAHLLLPYGPRSRPFHPHTQAQHSNGEVSHGHLRNGLWDDSTPAASAAALAELLAHLLPYVGLLALLPLLRDGV